MKMSMLVAPSKFIADTKSSNMPSMLLHAQAEVLLPYSHNAGV